MLASISKLTYATPKHCATLCRFIKTTHTTLSAARRTGRKDLPRTAGVFRRQTPRQATTFLIANLELELVVSHRKISLLKIPNRKKIAISLSTKWHRHSCLCAVIRLGIRPAEGVTSRPSNFQNLIDTPRLESPATTTKLSPLPISNRDKIRVLHPACLGGVCTFIVAAIPPASLRNLALRRSRPKTFSASTPVLDFAQQFCSEENFSAITANRWNFGLCATIPREPRQARKGATVTGQLRVPRNTRSSSLARPLLKIAADFSRLRIIGVPKTVRIDISPAHRYDGSRVTSHKLRVTDSR
jgi:hypothetical protein